MVTQENYLFSGTIADNIRFGRPDATQAEVEAATRAVGAHELHRRACPRATTPTSPTAAAGSAPASASWSRSRGRSSPTRRC